uniref:Uncharacterized protein n=1 Tax=Anopheles atroparvus TaxID=41427 RepID=A0AAG5DM28_ANOAO
MVWEHFCIDLSLPLGETVVLSLKGILFFLSIGPHTFVKKNELLKCAYFILFPIQMR